MAIEMTKPWRPLSPAGLEPVAGHMGVYELADAAGTLLYVGMAGGRSLHGLRGELLRWCATPQGATQYRLEVSTSYLTRWLELLMAHRARHGGLPPLNPAEDARRLGRLSPA